jgi:NADPH:quinone reductase-like Zn-dependent oxidoreductase
MSFTQAAAIPHAAELALQAIQAAPRLQPGQQVLVNGAGGGVGTLAIQLLKPHGVETTGVDRAEKLELLRSLEYDHVIEYPKNDFTRLGKLYDLILDTKTSHSVLALTRVLKPGGAYITVGGDKVGGVALLGATLGRFTGKRFKVVALKPNKNLVDISRLFESGTLTPVIDRVFAFANIRAALSRFRRAEHRGKIVIEVATRPN